MRPFSTAAFVIHHKAWKERKKAHEINKVGRSGEGDVIQFPKEFPSVHRVVSRVLMQFMLIYALARSYGFCTIVPLYTYFRLPPAHSEIH